MCWLLKIYYEPVIYLQIKLPKTRRRGAAIQYATISEPGVVHFLCTVWNSLKKDDFLYPGSAGAFRSRWDAVLKHIGVGKQHRLTPGSLRGGGAVACHKKGTPISDLLWRMRLQHQRTLSYYLQETTAMSMLPALEESVRLKVQFLRDALPLFLHQRGPAAHTVCPEVAARLHTRCQPRWKLDQQSWSVGRPKLQKQHTYEPEPVEPAKKKVPRVCKKLKQFNIYIYIYTMIVGFSKSPYVSWTTKLLETRLGRRSTLPRATLLVLVCRTFAASCGRCC